MKIEHTCLTERNADDLARCYLDYCNNYMTTSRFAEAYGMKGWEALKVINAGREIHEGRAQQNANQ